MWIIQENTMSIEQQDTVQQSQISWSGVFDIYKPIGGIWSIIFKDFETGDILRETQISQFYRYLISVLSIVPPKKKPQL
jgi:hypothetical protein